MFVIFNGCSFKYNPFQKTQHYHNWVNDPIISDNESENWKLLEFNKYFFISSDKKKSAENLLKDTSIIEIPISEVNNWLRKKIDLKKYKSKCYLIRGLSYTSIPYWCKIWYNKQQNNLWIQQATNVIENILFTSAVRQEGVKTSPMIIFLDKLPDKIYITALYGGDWVMMRRGKMYDETYFKNE